MTAETMLVRTLGGDVVRRPASGVQCLHYLDGRSVPIQYEPELADDEMAVYLLCDPLPLIIKTR